MLVPTWLHFPSPNPLKSLRKLDPKMHQIFDGFLHRFFVHFSSNLGPKLGPCWPLFPPKTGGAICPLLGFLPTWLLEPPGDPFGTHFGLLGGALGPFRIYFGPFFGTIFNLLVFFFSTRSYPYLDPTGSQRLELDGLL